MNTRQAKLLAAIIDQFIETALPVGSKELLRHCTHFQLSGATIRNEMRVLGEEGFLEQPHISAGRVPTAKGYRVYVRELMQPSKEELKVRRTFETLKEHYFRRKDQERAYDAVSLLSHMIPNIVFATVPHKERVTYLGLANVLQQPEFQMNPRLTTGIVEVLERRLTDFLEHVTTHDRVRYYIGDEHLLAQMQSCSVLLTSYRLRSELGVIGIIGPMRMDYGYNTAALEMVADLLRSA